MLYVVEEKNKWINIISDDPAFFGFSLDHLAEERLEEIRVTWNKFVEFQEYLSAIREAHRSGNPLPDFPQSLTEISKQIRSRGRPTNAERHEVRTLPT
jgi:hypothetical protein